MMIRPIRTQEDHVAAIARIAELWSASPGSEDAAELDALATLVNAYESRLVELPFAEPLKVLHYAITDMGRTQAELADVLGSRSRASEVLKGKRALTLDMVRAIGAAWKIPVALLVGTSEGPVKRRGFRTAAPLFPARRRGQSPRAREREQARRVVGALAPPREGTPPFRERERKTDLRCGITST